MEIKSLKDVVSNLQNKLECSQLDANSKDKEVKVLKVNMRAFKRQTYGFHLEYNWLMDDNESLCNQLVVFDQKHSTSGIEEKFLNYFSIATLVFFSCQFGTILASHSLERKLVLIMVGGNLFNKFNSFY
jgi:hypothetical protein